MKKQLQAFLFMALFTMLAVPVGARTVDDASPPPIEWADQAVISTVSSIQIATAVDAYAIEDFQVTEYQAVAVQGFVADEFGIIEDPIPIRSTTEIRLSRNWKNWPSGKPRTVYRHLDHYDRC